MPVEEKKGSVDIPDSLSQWQVYFLKFFLYPGIN